MWDSIRGRSVEQTRLSTQMNHAQHGPVSIEQDVLSDVRRIQDVNDLFPHTLSRTDPAAMVSGARAESVTGSLAADRACLFLSQRPSWVVVAAAQIGSVVVYWSLVVLPMGRSRLMLS